MTNKETIALGMHSNLLVSVIRDQAGSFFKAILEGVQNSVDAGATRIDVNLDNKTLEIIDDGCGFQSREEVMAHFATFGTPHEEGDSVFGRFRMGRGQLLNLGRTIYRTGTFEFDVDIEQCGLNFDLTEGLQHHKGCHIRISLYNPLTVSEQHGIARDLKKAVKYLYVPVYLNGEQISVHPENEKWDREDDDAYYRFTDNGSIAIYHLGCFISDYPAHTLGSGGIVVAKKNLLVNFARNDVKSTCPVWRRIRNNFQKQSNTRNRKKPRLDDAARQNLIEQLVDGEIKMEEVWKTRLLTDATGAHLSFHQLTTRTFRHDASLAFAPLGDRVADRAMAAGVAIVLSEGMLGAFGVTTPNEWVRLIKPLLPTYRSLPVLVSMDMLSERFDSGYEILDEKLWRPLERAWIACLESAVHWRLSRAFGDQGYPRRFLIGVSGVAEAWTDGRSYIAIERDFLASCKGRGMEDCFRLAQLVTHEYCHGEPSMGNHLHDKAFYQNYHDAHELTAAIARDLFSGLTQSLLGKKKMTTTKMRKTQDRIEGIRRETEELLAAADELDKLNEELEAAITSRKEARKKRNAAKARNTRLKKRLAA